MIILGPIVKKKGSVILAGAGLYSKTIDGDTVVYRSGGSDSFRGAWWCDAYLVSGTVQASMTRGLVNGLEPQIQGTNSLVSEGILKGPWAPSGGGEKVGSGKAAAREQMWIVVKVQVVLETGKMVAQVQGDVSAETLSVELSDKPYGVAGEGGLYGFTPLAMLYKKNDVLHVYQVAFFSYKHSTSRRQLSPLNPLPVGIWRHFFHAA